MRWLLALLTSLPLFAATGDVLNGAVLPDGWMVVLRVEGAATNGTFNFGFANATNNTFNGGEKFRMTVNAPGYSGAGVGATNVWEGTLYGTARIRFAYPDEDFPRVVIDGSDALIYISLSLPVFAVDTGLAATIGAGLYTSSSATNNAASLTLTNYSLLSYSSYSVMPNWSMVFNNQMSNTTVRVRATGWHASAQNGQPLAAMHFFATDESGDVITNTETRMKLDRTIGDLFPTGEYYTDFDISSLTHSNLIRFDFRAEPWRGDSGAVFDTRANRFAWPTFLPQSMTNFYYTNAYGSVAVVASTGVDATGKPYPAGTDPTTIPSGEYFLTGSKASHAIRTNNLAVYGHDTVASGIVYHRSTSDRPFGSSTWTFGNTPVTWITFTNYPGESVVWTNVAGTDDISDRVKVTGDITIGTLSSDIMFLSIQALWLDGVTFNSTGAGPIQTGVQAVQYLTRVNMVNWAADIPFGNNNHAVGLMRACNLSGFDDTGGIIWYNAIGNLRTNTVAIAGFTWRDDKSSHTVTNNNFQISYNNYLMGLTNSVVGEVGLQELITDGKAVVQNVFEGTHNSSSLSVVSANLNATNVLWLHNVCVGPRNQWFYNASPAATGAVMTLNTIKHSVAMVLGEATDIDGPGFDADRTNDWSMRWRVGGSGVINMMTTNTFTHADPEFNGLRSFRPPLPAAGQRTMPGWAKFVDDRSFGSGNNPAVSQGGNYRLQTHSPILEEDYTHLFWGVPFDMDGLPRGRFDPPGAFAAGNYRRGGFF